MRATVLGLALMLTVGVLGVAGDGSVAGPVAEAPESRLDKYTEWKECWIHVYPDKWCTFCIEHICVREVLDGGCLALCTAFCLLTGKAAQVCNYLCGMDCVSCTEYRTKSDFRCYDLLTPRPMYDPHGWAGFRPEGLPW